MSTSADTPFLSFNYFPSPNKHLITVSSFHLSRFVINRELPVA